MGSEMDKMREEFETCFKEYNLDISESSGRYFDNYVHGLWEGWQASRAALCVKLPSAWYQDVEGYILNREDDVKSSLDDVGVRYE